MIWQVNILLAACLLLAMASARAEERVVGLAQDGQPIVAEIIDAATEDARTVLIVAGLAGRDAGSEAVIAEAARYADLPAAGRPYRLMAIAVGNPAGAGLVIPPIGAAYREHAESHVLWRWIGLAAPDHVLVVGDDDDGLAAALSSSVVGGVGSIPARQVEPDALRDELPAELVASPAAEEVRRRVARSPTELAAELSEVFGHEFDRALYIPGMALIARLRLGNVDHVRRLAAPYISGERDSFDGQRFGLSLYLAGHLVFAELARTTGEAAYVRLARRAADFAFDDDGDMLEAMPGHGEMSDSIFMGAAILAAVGDLTGERRYFDMAARHIGFMNGFVRREDGLYRHSPLTDAAWGRGNAFALIGYALVLSDFPEDHPARAGLLAEYRQLAATLATFQTPDGMWRQVVDHPGAYQETSSTAMIGFSLLRGVRRGWLDADTFGPSVERAWRGVLRRTGDGGTFVDVSESTNKQDSLQAYLHREALHEPDPRTGGMTLLFAVEMLDASR